MPTANLLARRYWLAAAFCWTIAIAILCLVDLRSFPSDVKVSNADKIIHIIFHFGFVILWCGFLKRKSKLSTKAIVMIVTASAAYGVVIELAQDYLTVSREASVEDVLANFTGALLALIFIRFRKSPAIHD